MNEVEGRLARIRGSVPPRTHNARTIAALTSNPGCARRAVMDAAGIDKPRIAAYAGFPAPFGQSRFALARGNAFEAQVQANGCAELLRLPVAGRHVYLEPDLIAFQLRDRFHVVEIKSFAVIDGQADGEKVAAAAIQSAVYVLALRELLAELGSPPEAVADEAILVCPENFANNPVATLLDVRKQLTVLRRQLSRLERIEDLLAELPPGLTFDLDPDAAGVPRRLPADLADAVRVVPARYAPECLSSCEMCYFCRDEARGETARLGRPAREELGCVDTITDALGLAAGTIPVPEERAEAAALLRTAARLRRECVGDAA